MREKFTTLRVAGALMHTLSAPLGTPRDIYLPQQDTHASVCKIQPVLLIGKTPDNSEYISVTETVCTNPQTAEFTAAYYDSASGQEITPSSASGGR